VASLHPENLPPAGSKAMAQREQNPVASSAGVHIFRSRYIL